MDGVYSLVGRLKERSELFKITDSAISGRGCTVFISGESGVGKTRLVEEVIYKSGMKIYIVRASDDGNSSYDVFRSLLREFVNQYVPVEDKKIDLNSLSVILPELGENNNDPGTNTLHETVITYITGFSRKQPIILFLDDIQWADNASLDLMQKLAERISSFPIALIGTYRSDEITPDHKIRKIRNSLRRTRTLKEIDLKPFDYFETRQQIENILNSKVEDSLAEEVYSHTQGLPLFTEEIVNTLLDEKYLIKGINGYKIIEKEIPVPESIKDAVLQRINNISGEARDLIEAASILGMNFPVEAAIRLSGSENGIDELFERKLLIEIPKGNASFRHVLIKEAIRSGITWSRRKMLHKLAAAFYEENNYPPELVAEHWMSSNETEKAREALIKSVELSCNLYAFDDAAEKANLALKIWPEHVDEIKRIRILFRYAHCSQINGRPDEALRALSEIMYSDHFEDDSAFAAEVYRLQGMIYGLKSQWGQATESRINAAEYFMKAGLFAESGLEFLMAARRLTAMVELGNALQNSEFAVKMAEEAKRNDLKARAMGLQGNILSMQGKFSIGKEVVRRALTIALESKDPEAASEVYRRLASTLEYASDYPAAKDAYLGAYNYCLSTGENINAQVCLGCMSYIFFQTGDWKGSTDICRKVINGENSPESSAAVAYGIMGLINAFRGEVKSAEKNLSKCIELSKKYNIINLELGALWGVALLYEISGNKEKVSDTYNLIISKWSNTQDTHDIIPVIMWAAEFYAENNMSKENAQCIEILAKIASTTGNAEAMAALAFSLAESSFMNKNYKEAKKQYEQALEHLEKLVIPVVQTKTEYHLGCCLIQSEEKKEAGMYLNRAYRTAKNLGMRPFSSQISRKMQEIGIIAEESRNPEAEGRIEAAGLTKRQKEILVLLSEGLTNKEISAKIFLSTRTVDMHVSNILQRFNCRTRTEAVMRAKEMQIL